MVTLTPDLLSKFDQKLLLFFTSIYGPTRSKTLEAQTVHRISFLQENPWYRRDKEAASVSVWREGSNVVRISVLYDKNRLTSTAATELRKIIHDLFGDVALIENPHPSAAVPQNKMMLQTA